MMVKGLPLIVLQLNVRSSLSSFPHPYMDETKSNATRFVCFAFLSFFLLIRLVSHKFDITMLHMGEKRITTFLLKPFFNLDLLRFILSKKETKKERK